MLSWLVLLFLNKLTVGYSYKNSRLLYSSSISSFGLVMPPVIGSQKSILTTLQRTSVAKSINHVLESLPIISNTSRIEDRTALASGNSFGNDTLFSIANGLLWLLEELVILGMAFVIGMIFFCNFCSSGNSY